MGMGSAAPSRVPRLCPDKVGAEEYLSSLRPGRKSTSLRPVRLESFACLAYALTAGDYCAQWDVASISPKSGFPKKRKPPGSGCIGKARWLARGGETDRVVPTRTPI